MRACTGDNLFLVGAKKTRFFRKHIENLIDAGSNVNCVHNEGNTCLHYLIDRVNKGERVNESLFHLLLKHSARWDIGNKDGISDFDKMDRHVWNMLFSLQAQCARVLRRESMIPFNMKAVASIIVELSDSFSFN